MAQKLKRVKNKINSAEGKADAAKGASKTIVPPEHIGMKERDLPFFNSIIKELANVEWTDHTIELAALLARAISDFERQQRFLRKEGTTVSGMHGPKINPRQQVLDKLASTILQMRRSLSLHARVKNGEPRDVAKRRAQMKEIQKGVAAIDEDDDDQLINTRHDEGDDEE